jgi:CyaY protein
MSSASAGPASASLSDAQYRALTADLLAAIERQVDRWLQDDVVDIDAARTGGLLELSLPDGSMIVVNTQPPLQEVWLAARRGGFHFRHVEGRWCDTKSGAEFFRTLSECTGEQAGKTLAFDPAIR